MGNKLYLKKETVNGKTTITTYDFSDTNDRLQSETTNGVVTASYTYDDNGNTKTQTVNGVTTEYTWNGENRMIAATVKNANGTTQQTMQYRYNDEGIRVASIVNGQETRYLLDTVQPYAQVLEEYSPNDTVSVSYVYGDDLISQKQGSNRTYYQVDGLGSTRSLTDTSGNVVSTYNYVELASVYVTGFNLGYFAAVGVRKLVEGEKN